MKKIISIILCTILLIAMFAGCVKKDTVETSETPEQTNVEDTQNGEEPEEDEAGTENDDEANTVFDTAYKAFAPDTIMITAGEYTVTWAEFFVPLFGNINNIFQSNGGILPDLSEVASDGRTYAETIIGYSVDYALMFKAMDYGAKLYGITLSQEERDDLQEELEQMIAQYGGEEELVKALREINGCYSLELFKYFREAVYLASRIRKEIYGEEGELISDEIAAEQTALNGYLMAKHILRLKPEDGEDTAKGEIEDILRQLDGYSGDDFDAFFDELMYEHSEDAGGLMSYPGGYLFQNGDMVSSFYEGCAALEIGKYSGAIESEYGYHIIYRLPINYDVVPFASYIQGTNASLRNAVASTLFDVTLIEWIDSMDITYTAEFNSIDIESIFK